MKRVFLCDNDSIAMQGIDWQLNYSEFYARIVAAKERMAFDDVPSEKRKNEIETMKVAIFSENSPDWVCAIYAAWLKGATVVPIDAKSSSDELAFILNDSTPQTVFVSRENLPIAEESLSKLSYVPQILVLEDLFENLESKVVEKGWKLELDEDDVALIVYTSGTTGNPKGVILTFENLWANIRAVSEAKYFTDGIRVLALLPFHHILPLMGTLIAPLSVRGKMVFPKSINPADIAEVLQKHSVDMVVSVPRFYEMIHANVMAKIRSSKIAKLLFNISKLLNSKKISQKIFSAVHKKFGGEVKFWICGGAPLDKRIGRDMQILGFTLCEGYGMTECAPIITFPRIDRIRLGSTGEALPAVEIRIVEGEICVRGKNVTRGYYKRPEETAQAIRNNWLYTGDLGYLDEENFLFITGRRKEIIVLPNGKNLDPAEMEMRIKAMSPDILEVGVLLYDNLLQAIIRVSPEYLQKYTPELLNEKIRNEIILPYNRATATYKRIIKFVTTTQELPRTRVGKLKRYQLASYIENTNCPDSIKSAPPPDSKIYEEIADIVKSQVAVSISADAHLEMDLGLDSLGKITLQTFIKDNYGVDIPEKDFEKYTTLRSLAEFVEKNKDEKISGNVVDLSWEKIIKSNPFPKLPKTNFLHFITLSILRGFSRIYYKTHIKGLENIPQNEAIIIAPNHQSFADGLFLCQSFSKTELYNTYFFAKLRSYIKKGFLRYFANKSNIIIMDITENVNESIRKIAAVLEKGKRVVIFPEGTRTKDGDIAEFKQSFAILAKEMKAKVVPVAIRGAYEALKTGSTMPNFRADVYVHYLPAMSPTQEESYAEFSTRVRNAIEEEWKDMKKLPMKLTSFQK